MAESRFGKAKAGGICLLLWLALSPHTMADSVYRCLDARAKTTIFQDRPCAIEQPAIVASLPVAVIASTPASAPVFVITPVAIAKPALDPKKEPEDSADLLDRSVWLKLMAVALLILSGAVLWLWRHGKRRPPERGWETQSLLILPGAPPPKPNSWNLPLLQSLEWKRFENLCAAYYRSTGQRAEPAPLGHEGGADIHLYRENESEPHAIVRCKAWLQEVELDEIQKFHAVQMAEGISQSIVISNSHFSKDAIAFAGEHNMTLLDAWAFLALLRNLPQAQSRPLLARITDGDYTTPSCPLCDQKMTEHEGSRGLFWGCRSYPLCQGKLSPRGTRIDPSHPVLT